MAIEAEQWQSGSISETCRLTTGLCGHRGQRTMFPDTFGAGAAQPGRYIPNYA